VRSISGPADMGILKGLLARMLDALGGRSEETFVHPTGVAEHDGVLYVADPGGPALWILDSARGRISKVTEVGGEPLRSPVGVAVRPDGAVFVADSELKRVFLLDRAGKLLWATAAQDLQRPAGLAFDAASGELYVADSAANRIRVFDAAGAGIRAWGLGGVGEGEFNHPTHLALQKPGALLVTDALNFRVQAFDAQGRFLWKFGHHGDGSGDFAAPKGVAADDRGRVYVVDALFGAIQIFQPDGGLLLAWGEQGSRPGQFWLPGGLYVNAKDEIYVADTYNGRVQVFAGVADAAAR